MLTVLMWFVGATVFGYYLIMSCQVCLADEDNGKITITSKKQFWIYLIPLGYIFYKVTGFYKRLEDK